MRGCALGQATVEAALLLPTLLTALAFLLQPVCVLYARAVMQGAAAEGARALATAYGGAATSAEVCAFVRRRLGAVPNLELFHTGGAEGWEIEAEGGGEEATACVSVTGHARPLPLIGGITQALGESDGEGLVLTARVEERVRPSWLGGSYDEWVGMWDGA